MLPAPRATSSRFGLMLYPNLPAFCFAATILSKNPTTEMSLRYIRARQSCKNQTGAEPLTQPWKWSSGDTAA